MVAAQGAAEGCCLDGVGAAAEATPSRLSAGQPLDDPLSHLIFAGIAEPEEHAAAPHPELGFAGDRRFLAELRQFVEYRA